MIAGLRLGFNDWGTDHGTRRQNAPEAPAKPHLSLELPVQPTDLPASCSERPATTARTIIASTKIRARIRQPGGSE